MPGNKTICAFTQSIIQHQHGDGACEGYVRMWMEYKANKKKIALQKFTNLEVNELTFRDRIVSMHDPASELDTIMESQDDAVAHLRYEQRQGTTPTHIAGPNWSDVAIRNNYKAIKARDLEVTQWANAKGLTFRQSTVEVNFIEPIANTAVSLAQKYGSILALLSLQGKNDAHALGFSVESDTSSGYYFNLFDPNTGETAYYDGSSAPFFFVPEKLTSYTVTHYADLQDLIYCQYFSP